MFWKFSKHIFSFLNICFENVIITAKLYNCQKTAKNCTKVKKMDSSLPLGIHPMGLSSLGGLIFRAIRLRGLPSRGIVPGGSQAVKNRPPRRFTRLVSICFITFSRFNMSNLSDSFYFIFNGLYCMLFDNFSLVECIVYIKTVFGQLDV